MPTVPWRDLPPMYAYDYSSAVLLGASYPFRIGVSELVVTRPEPIHWHDAFEIGFVLDGSGIFVLEGVEYAFGPGHVHVINDSYQHMAYTFDHARIFNVHFHPQLLQDATFHGLTESALRPFTAPADQFAPLLPADHPYTTRVIDQLHNIMLEHECANVGWPLMVKGLLLQIVGLLLRHFVVDAPPDPQIQRHQGILRRIAPALRLLEERLVQPPTLDQLATTVAMSPSHFGVLFRQAVGRTPVEYRNARRVMVAQRLLLDHTAPISEIAVRCGFATVQQFNRTFRGIVGCTPSQYRVQVQ